MPFEFNEPAWDKVVSDVLAIEGVSRMMRVRDACNSQAGTDEYKLSTEGDNPLRKRDFRVTVITAGKEAIRDNNRNNRLLANFHLAGGS